VPLAQQMDKRDVEVGMVGYDAGDGWEELAAPWLRLLAPEVSAVGLAAEFD